MSSPMFRSCVLPFKSAPIGLPTKLFTISFDKVIEMVLWFTLFLSRWSVFPSSDAMTLLNLGHIELETFKMNSLQFSLTICLTSLSFCSSFPGFRLSCIFFAFTLCFAKVFLSVGGVPAFFLLFFFKLPFFFSCTFCAGVVAPDSVCLFFLLPSVFSISDELAPRLR